MKKLLIINGALLLLAVSCSNGVTDASGSLKKIVFVGRTNGVYTDIYCIYEDGSERTNLTNTSNTAEYYPKWSPNGNKIYFLREESSKFYLYVMNEDGTGQSRITD